MRAAKNPEDSATYRLQYTAGRKWAHPSDTDVYIVISDSESEDRGVAMKSAIMRAPGGALHEYVSRMGVNAWVCASFGDTSSSFNAVVMNGSPNLDSVPPARRPTAFVRFVGPRSMTAVFRAQDTGLHVGVLRARARFEDQFFCARCCKGSRRRLRGPVGDESAIWSCCGGPGRRLGTLQTCGPYRLVVMSRGCQGA